MNKLLLAIVAVVLAGCASVIKVEGDQVVNERLKITVAEAWNKLPNDTGAPFQVWTQEGVTLDHLRFWAAVRPDQNLIVVTRNSVPAGQTAPRVPTYRAGMRPDELVNLFELVYSADGSVVTMEKVAPAVFAGESGVRFEFSLLRQSDGLRFKGVGWAAVRNDELFAASFVAPRLAFYPRLLPKAEQVVSTARIL